MPVSCTPWMGKVTGGTASSPQSLQSLLQALGTTRKPAGPGVSNQLKAAYVNIQADPAGSGNYYIGSFSDMSSTDAGVALSAAQPWAPPSFESNLYRLDQIFLMADTNSANWFVTFVTR